MNAQLSWRHSEEWRWEPDYHSRPTHRSITVIERSTDDTKAAVEREKDKRRVPFGFARVLAPEPKALSQADWEGDGG